MLIINILIASAIFIFGYITGALMAYGKKFDTYVENMKGEENEQDID